MQGFDNAVGRRSKNERMSDYADMAVWPERDYGSFRMIGPLYCILSYWFTIITERKPGGVPIPKMCLDHDGRTDKLVSDVCPFRASGLGRESREYFINVIDRAEQEGREYRRIRNPIEEHLGFKARWVRVGDHRLTPVRLLAIPDSQIDKLKGMKKLNKVRGREGEIEFKDITDPRFGRDINLLYDGEKKGPARYDSQMGERTPITDEERNYGMYRPDLLKPMKLEDAKREMEDLASKIAPRKDAKGGAKGGARGGRADADDPLMDDATTRFSQRDLEDDGYGERPTRGRGRSRDDNDGYEDDRPARGGDRRSSRSRGDYDDPPARGARGGRDRDDDYGDDDDNGGDDAPDDLDADFDDRGSRGADRGGRSRGRDDYDDDRRGGGRRSSRRDDY